MQDDHGLWNYGRMNTNANLVFTRKSLLSLWHVCKHASMQCKEENHFSALSGNLEGGGRRARDSLAKPCEGSASQPENITIVNCHLDSALLRIEPYLTAITAVMMRTRYVGSSDAG